MPPPPLPPRPGGVREERIDRRKPNKSVVRSGRTLVSARVVAQQRPSLAHGHGADASLKNRIGHCKIKGWLNDRYGRLRPDTGQTALEVAVRFDKHETAAYMYIRQADVVRRLCGVRQRLAFATAMLTSAEATSGLCDLLSHDRIGHVCEVAVLGLPAVHLTLHAAAEHLLSCNNSHPAQRVLPAGKHPRTASTTVIATASMFKFGQGCH